MTLVMFARQAARAQAETGPVSAFERLIYFDLAEKFGKRTKIALFEDKPEHAAEMARMAGHFALQAMSGRPDTVPEPDAEPDEEPASTGAEEEDTRDTGRFEDSATYRQGLIDAGRGHLVRGR